MNSTLIIPLDLANRWNMSVHTLSQWRWSGRGPLFLKVNGKILYRLEDIEAFEETRIRQSTSTPNLCFPSSLKKKRPGTLSTEGVNHGFPASY